MIVKILCYCHTHDADNNILKMTGSQSFRYIGSLIDFNRLGQLRFANTTTMAILKKRLNVSKAQNGHHIKDFL